MADAPCLSRTRYAGVRVHSPGPSSRPHHVEEPVGSPLTFPEGYPQVFGNYVLVRPMARGGMGELFVAAAGGTRGFEKLCVVKKVLHSLDDPAVQRRFLDEAKIVVRLNHANLVQVFDAGQVDNEYYLAMELVEGKDLRAVWNRCAQLQKRIPVDIALFVIREVLRGLDYAHDVMQLGLVHRDISPPNVLVGYRGEVKVTDFGLAKSAIKREKTSPGIVFGRYSYLSPEQAKGLPADRRTDIYACGIVLWELLTGRQLFPSTNRSHQEALAAVRNPKVTPPSQLVPGIPDGVDAILVKGLQKNPDDRYATGGEFRAALSEVLSRDFPTCDTDRVSDFMREIFVGEVRDEGREFASYMQHDFSEVRRKRNENSKLISISDLLDDSKSSSSVISLGESDIVELDRSNSRLASSPNLSSLEETARTWVGRVVAQRYRVDDLLGIGGMGAVYRVTHLALGKPFALKVLHRIYTTNSDLITRFMREARAATQTGHPNIIDVLDVGTTDHGDVYFVMELLEGQNVSQVVDASGPLAIRRAVHIARQIARALAAAHEAGIIHRDLKSENVVLIHRGKDPDFVKVLDFGICKKIGSTDPGQTNPGLVMGSPSYMAPEQASGVEATVATDVYAIGCILYEVLTGRLPFESNDPLEVLMLKSSVEAPRVTQLRPEVPEALTEVIARCLKRNPPERPPSMRAREYELTRAVDGRASAVAAVLGLGPTSEDLRPDDSLANAPIVRREAALHAQSTTSRGAMPQRAASSSASLQVSGVRPTAATAMWAGFRAIVFVVLGGALTFALLWFFVPDLLPGLAKLRERVTPQRPVVVAPPLEAKVAQGNESPAPAPEPAPSEVTPSEPLPPQNHAGAQTAPELVAAAERALADGRFTEPVDDSLATLLGKLAIVQPGSSAISRLRTQAAATLMPDADRAARNKDWKQAVRTYRTAVAVWPDLPSGREKLEGALWELARTHQEAGEEDAALAVVDELLNMRADDFRYVLLRAELLADLQRWPEAKAAYATAKGMKPRHKGARQGYARAARKAR